MAAKKLRKEPIMTEHVNSEEVKEDTWDHVCRLFSELPKVILNTEGPKPDKRKTNNSGW